MAMIFAQLPALDANGPGEAVDVSAFGGMKSVVNAGNGGLEPNVTVEICNDPSGTYWTPLRTFTRSDHENFVVSCWWMRAVVSNYRGGGAPRVDVGAELSGTGFATLVCPPDNGPGPATSASNLGLQKTFQVGGTFKGTVEIEVSENGTDAWGVVASFAAAGHITLDLPANHLRASRAGVPTVDPGLPVVYVAATAPASGGGGGDGNRQSFVVTLSGEPDRSDFVVALPLARSSTAYDVQCTLQGVESVVGFDVPDADKTTASFRVVTTMALSVGDKLAVTVQDRT